MGTMYSGQIDNTEISNVARIVGSGKLTGRMEI